MAEEEGTDDNKRIVSFVVLGSILCTITLLICIYVMYSRWTADASQSICEATMKEKPGIEGVWFSNGYYCVWAAGRNIKDINATDAHEACHALAHDDPKHFCGWYNES